MRASICILPRVDGLEVNLRLPDFWQQEAVKHIEARRDVVVHAPTGAGKTFIFELLAERGLPGRAIYTVPTRALANDKHVEWRERGWNVGIATGDLAVNLDAPLIVATLETQKRALLEGRGPALLVVDEYQMLGDAARGVNYELAVALAPPGTQLLMLSGSVGNPEKVVNWLRRIGRDAVLVHHSERPVAQEEVHLEALREPLSSDIRGFWPVHIARALAAGFGPILIFAPKRHEAEKLARKLTSALPSPEPLQLTPHQRALAGPELTRLLRNRICFHHSGLGYQQRAGLIEPLAKRGHLQVVVATTGLAAGINFCMRSVIVTDREYRAGREARLLRQDELLQMFGRAGRRGHDERGYVLVAPGKPRMGEGRPLTLRRTPQVDWPSFLALMRHAAASGHSPRDAVQRLADRLFTANPPELGLGKLAEARRRSEKAHHEAAEQTRKSEFRLREMLNSASEWERLKPPVKVRLDEALYLEDGQWCPALSMPDILKGLEGGNICRLKGGRNRRYGRHVTLASFPKADTDDSVLLTKWLSRRLRQFVREKYPERRLPVRKWPFDRLESDLLPLLPYLTDGGRAERLEVNESLISARLDYGEAKSFARVDSLGKALINPPVREVEPEPFPAFAELAGISYDLNALSAAEAWLRLGLIDSRGRPTRRGAIFSFFNHGEGLAIAAALEDESYAASEIVSHLANLRAGPRFEDVDNANTRLGDVCRLTFRGATCTGYLREGVPPTYGPGAVEILLQAERNPGILCRLPGEVLKPGDVERARLEWRSLLNHIANAPDLDWERWRQLQLAARELLARWQEVDPFSGMPELTAHQRERFVPRHAYNLAPEKPR